MEFDLNNLPDLSSLDPEELRALSSRLEDLYREVEAQEGDPVVQEITAPDGKCVEGEKSLMLDALQGENAFLHLVDHILHLRHERETLHEQPKEEQRDDQTDGSDDIARGGESSQDITKIGARAVEERGEDAHLREDDNEGDEKDEQGVNHTFGDHCAQ